MKQRMVVPAPDTGTVVGAPAVGADGHQYADVTLDSSGLTVNANLLNTSAHATSGSPVGTYLVGDRVAIQLYPYGSKVAAVVLGVLS